MDMKIENIAKIKKACYGYVKDIKQYLLQDFIEVIDDENIRTDVLKELEMQFNLLYELKKDYGIEDDRRVGEKTNLVVKQILYIMDK